VRGFPAEALNGDLSQQAREQVLNRFRNNQIKVLVATDVAARAWTSTIFRTSSTLICRRMLKFMCIASVARAARAKPAWRSPC
jgi:hypothetical protein